LALRVAAIRAAARLPVAADAHWVRFVKQRGILSSEPKCNTPADLIIGTVDQDLRECCHAMLFAFVG
jgi:hypothetical protein